MDFDITALIKSLGYIGVFAAVFAESGLLVGMFLPGDSLLFTAGFLASQGILNFPLLLVITFVAAVAGDTTGYITGKRYGHKVFKKDDALFLNKKHIERSEAFYAKHGGKTLILARFTPVVRTIAPILAGVGKMTYRKFFIFNLIGAFLWAVGVTSLGYFLGNVIPDVERYIIPGVIIIVAVSIIPSMLHFLRDVENRNKIKSAASSVRRKKQ
jgi:membrane-associated protein